jgi:hypothetical protein
MRRNCGIAIRAIRHAIALHDFASGTKWHFVHLRG